MPTVCCTFPETCFAIPCEGYGFSNDARAWFGPPSFADASFHYDGRGVDLTIAMHY